MVNNYFEKYLTNRLAKEKYADLIFKIVEKIYGILFTSLLSVSAIYLIFPATGITVPFGIILTLTVVGLMAAIVLTVLALKISQELGNEPIIPNGTIGNESQEQRPVSNQIDMASSGNLYMSINCGQTKITIRIVPTLKEFK